MMNIEEDLIRAFPMAQSWYRDTDIQANPNLMELPRQTIDLIAVVPAYMLWCARHSDSSELVADWTLAALAEYGRCKDPSNEYLNFLHLCSASQMEVVISFLEWASSAMPFHPGKRLERTLRNWKVRFNALS